MRRPTVIVTGLIGSGKSAVCDLLRVHGVPVYDCDTRTKSIYDRRPFLVRSLEKALEEPLRGADGRLDRGRLAACIFRDAAARETVESIVYPYVLRDFRRWRARQTGAPFVALESAVILSKPLFAGLASAVVLVTAPEELRLQRVMARDALPESQVRARMAAQPEIPASAATFILENDGDPEKLGKAVNRIIKTLQI